ncbi:HNH endonuclease [Vibrio splendidus]|uniref:HNH endonuclease n=1 Tax=Vibrio splendidus TaxID=29497 RepID=UPI000D3A7E7B|nr:HNH endonuclease signature motif containing protein [Vibrio splendidus]PTO69524.1 HNH endonuclease [Vibrio splendidus]
MKVGKLVQLLLPKILEYCEHHSYKEIERLCDADYSKRTFNINFPFLIEISNLPADISKRYWTNTYLIRGKTVRACSQWFEKDLSYFVKYLKRIGICYDEYLLKYELVDHIVSIKQRASAPSPRVNRRYKEHAIGNAQNALVRNILSRLGTEQITKEDWEETKAYFMHECVYCGEAITLQIDHAIPINKQRLGEHRLGNLVPSCKECNNAKSSRDFREFLGEDIERTQFIEDYMESKNYVPLENNEQVQMILEMAYREVGAVAERYIKIINELFVHEDDNDQQHL